MAKDEPVQMASLDFTDRIVTGTKNPTEIDPYNQHKESITVNDSDAPINLLRYLESNGEKLDFTKFTYTYQRQLATAIMGALGINQNSVTLTAQLGSGKTRVTLTVMTQILALLSNHKNDEIRRANMANIHPPAFKRTEYSGFPGAELVNAITTRTNLPVILAFAPNNVAKEVWINDSSLFPLNVVSLNGVGDIIGFMHRVLEYFGYTVAKPLRKNKIPPIEEIDVVLSGINASRSMDAIRRELPEVIHGYDKSSTNATQFILNAFALLNITPIICCFDDIDTNSPGSVVVNHNWFYIVTTATHSTKNSGATKRMRAPISSLLQFELNESNVVTYYMTNGSIVNISLEHLKSTIDMPIPQVYQVSLAGSYGTISELLRQTNRIEQLQQLTSGNPEAIAKSLGISTGSSPAEMLRAMLAEDWEKYKRYTALITYLELLHDICIGEEDSDPFNDMQLNNEKVPSDQDWEHFLSPENLKNTLTILMNEDEDAPEETLVKDHRVPPYYGRALSVAVMRRLTPYKNAIKGPQIVVDRIESSLSAENCVTCSRSKDDPSIKGWIVNSCCMYRCCTDCAAKNFSADKEGNCRCINCFNVAPFTDTTMFVNKNLDMQALLEGGVDSFAIDTLVNNETVKTDSVGEEIIEEDRSDLLQIPNTKIEALCMLLKGARMKGVVPVPKYQFSAVLGTDQGIPHPDYKNGSNDQKTLIYSTAEGERLSEKLKDTDITEYCKIFTLHGAASEAIKIINEFRKYSGKAALIASSVKQCSGLNIQFLNTVVFFNMNADINCTEQGVGRGQRVGRDPNLGPLKVICLCYKEEAIVPDLWNVIKE